jgi:AcrR family transcriptional regulator
MPRLSRREKQARTRSSLMKSAAKVFCRKGMESASIDEVAEDAGYTKGAFYANFKSKEELFLAMLDERFAERIQEIDRVFASDDPPDQQAREAAADFIRYIESDLEWERLFFEFSAYAARNEDFRQELVTRYRTLRERIAEGFVRRCEELEVEPPIPPDQFATMIVAMGNGIALEKLLEPEAVPEDLYPTMLASFFLGMREVAEQQAPSA